MDGGESLCLSYRFESTYAPLSHSRWLMGKFYTIIGILPSVMEGVRNQLTVRNTIAAQFVRDDLPRLGVMAFK